MATRELRYSAASVAEALGLHVTLVTRKITLDTHANLVEQPARGGTPVDTGYARANWTIQVGAPRRDPVGPPPVLDPGGTLVGASGKRYRGTIDLGPLEDGKVAVTGFKIGDGDIYITNNAHYIGRLNEGSSKQAKPGFVEAAMKKALTVDIRR